LVTTVGSTVAESGLSDDDADDDRPLKDWGTKATPEPTDDAAIEAKNAARLVGKASMVFQCSYGSMLLILPLKSRPFLSLRFDSPLIRLFVRQGWWLSGMYVPQWGNVMLVFDVPLLSLTRSP